MFLPHERKPAGVPTSYDWKARPKLTGNPSEGMGAMTGWLQAFTIGANHGWLQISNLQTWARTGRVWALLQSGDVEGAVFAPSFAGNVNTTPTRLEHADGVATVEWPNSGAWHCWPLRRAVLPACDEIAVACQVRATLPLLVGCGADYWRTLSAPYGDGSNNPGIGIGRLRVIGPEWAWVGFSSAP